MYALSSTSEAKVNGNCETRKTLILVPVIQKAPYPPSICTHRTAELPTRYCKLHWPYGSVFIFALIIFIFSFIFPFNQSVGGLISISIIWLAYGIGAFLAV